jgi:hypothetical protein
VPNAGTQITLNLWTIFALPAEMNAKNTSKSWMNLHEPWRSSGAISGQSRTSGNEQCEVEKYHLKMIKISLPVSISFESSPKNLIQRAISY